MIFADTSFYIALLLPDDEHHPRAVQLAIAMRVGIVTTTGVLAELGNFMSPPAGRRRFVAFVRDLIANPAVSVVDLDEYLFDAALRLFADRPDQSWSFVDCASFVVMRHRRITEALTADHHFEQARFTALLR